MRDVRSSFETATSFRVIDTGESRKDLTSRREVKYTIQGMDAGRLRRLLETNCHRLIHNNPVSVVRSIYFDDARLSACRANLDGLGLRNKLRLRWYDTPRPTTDFFLEIKWRNNLVTGKHRLQIKADEPISEMPYSEICRNLDAVIPDHLVQFWSRYNEPTIIVQYQREHFATDDGLRITLDYDLAWYDQTGRQSISTSFPVRQRDFIVIEGKTPVGREAELRRWLHPYAPRASRCSKYVYGCCQIGLIRENEL